MKLFLAKSKWTFHPHLQSGHSNHSFPVISKAAALCDLNKDELETHCGWTRTGQFHITGLPGSLLFTGAAFLTDGRQDPPPAKTLSLDISGMCLHMRADNRYLETSFLYVF